jgi:general stress protein 26
VLYLFKSERLKKMNQDIIKKAGEIINSKTGYIGGGMEGYAVLALIDENGYPTASTLTIAKADGIKWLTFNTSLDRDSVKRINKCNRSSVCINSSEYNITLVGKIEVLTDPDTKNDMWFPVMEGQWNSPDNPDYCVLRFTTERYSLFVGYEEVKGDL